MSEDVGQSAFLAESRELLQVMEDALLELEQDAGDEEMIAAIFRAAHTIKGTGGVFGFDEVVEFTHVVENVLDKVRANELQIDSKLIALLLKCRDHMEALVECAVAEEDVDADEARTGEALIVALNTYLKVESTAVVLTPGAEEASSLEAVSYDGPKVENDNWHISIRFSQDVLRYGMDPLSFLRYLTRLGDIDHVEFIDNLPDNLTQLDPEACYCGYEVLLNADTSKADIEKVFEFVKEDCELSVLPPQAYIQQYIALIEQRSDELDRIGDILLKCGALTEHELEQTLKLQSESKTDKSGAGAGKKLGEIAVEQQIVHPQVVEAAVEQQKKVRAPSAAKTIRVDAMKLDQLVNLVGEMVIAGASTKLIANSLGHDPLSESMSVLSRLVEEIRDSALRLRMVQIGDTFNRFQRVVRDISQELSKDIKLEVSGGDTELDKTVVEKIGDPLMHLVRNAMDHGLESPEERVQAGKPAQGKVTLNAFHDSGSIVIEVSDDGRGLDGKKLLAKAMERGLISSGQHLTEREIHHLIFEPGFSTAAEVTNLSGRGVGMDVVLKNIEALRGSIDVDSEPGSGTTISIRLPLTLAIIDGFLVGVGDSSYVIPLDMINECVEVDEQHEHRSHINLRGEVLPLLYLRDFFEDKGDDEHRENIVVVQFGALKAGLVVDSLLGEFQTVIKPLGKIFKNLKGISGSTILGSGEVAVILDVPGLLQMVSGHSNLVGAGKSQMEFASRLH